VRGGNAIAVAASTRPNRHESFLAYSRYRYLWFAVLIVVATIVLYIVDRPYGTRYGGTWAGYTLGVAGALLIVWLTWFGYRKRSYAEAQGRLVGRLSAHVYFGLALLVIVTLHTGFHVGWNVHTLAYALMCLVIASGMLGVFCYMRYPRLMTENRGGMTMQQMIGTIATLDEQLRVAAMPLDETTAMVVERAVETSAIGQSLWRQLTRRYPGCTTAAAIVHLDAIADDVPAALEEAWSQVRVLLDEKSSLLTRVRRDVSYKAMIDFWLLLHVPLSFMLLAALFAHIVSVFFLW
jgi:hypothetical protein